MKVFICLGQPPVAGCGRVLTDEERHYYEYCCEDCTRAWGDAVDAWRKGGADPAFDKIFDEPKGTIQ